MTSSVHPAKRLRGANRFFDERLGTQSFLKKALDHIFPDNWTFMFGEMAFYCFIILVLSGVFLTFFFDPGDTQVIYSGPYLPLHGVHMSTAYESVVRISLEVRAGLLFRQMHHWAADLFIASIFVHMCRIFFTGAFRKPRDINWLVGLSLLLLSVFNGFTGYSLPDDLMSGLGLRIAYSIAESVPIAGPWLAYLLFGGQFPSDQVEHRLYLAHIMIIPGLIFALLGVHLALIWHQKHTQFPGKGRSNKKLVGSQLWPTYALRSTGLFAAVAGVLAILGGTVQINPIWLYGPYQPWNASVFAQPDWYVGWLEGALRLFPGWRLHLFGYTVSEDFWPAAFFPLLTFAVLYAWPWLERWVTGDRDTHNVLDRPRDRPMRTALGVGGITLYLVLTLAGAQDIIAYIITGSQPEVTLGLRGLAITLPPLCALVAWKVCHELKAVRQPIEGEPPEGDAGSATPAIEEYLEPVDRVRAALASDGAARGVPVGATQPRSPAVRAVSKAAAAGTTAFLGARQLSHRRRTGSRRGRRGRNG
jgi:ubiquinol-cytochrome c reductase cytochrome b subunit